jgi:hypothetical protein
MGASMVPDRCGSGRHAYQYTRASATASRMAIATFTYLTIRAIKGQNNTVAPAVSAAGVLRTSRNPPAAETDRRRYHRQGAVFFGFR